MNHFEAYNNDSLSDYLHLWFCNSAATPPNRPVPNDFLQEYYTNHTEGQRKDH